MLAYGFIFLVLFLSKKQEKKYFNSTVITAFESEGTTNPTATPVQHVLTYGTRSDGALS